MFSFFSLFYLFFLSSLFVLVSNLSNNVLKTVNFFKSELLQPDVAARLKPFFLGQTHGVGSSGGQCPPVIGSSLPSHKIAAAGSALGPPPSVFRLDMAAPRATISHVIFDMDGLLLGNSPPPSSSTPSKPKIPLDWMWWFVVGGCDLWSPCSCQSSIYHGYPFNIWVITWLASLIW